MPSVGIVIPTLNEAGSLPLLLKDLARLSLPSRIVVADGGSNDGTPENARDAGVEVVQAPRGRACQMNAGAEALETPWLLFLHADTRFPARSLKALEDWLGEADSRDFATFSFSLEGEHWFWRFIELGQRIRENTFGLAYGDQGLLVARSLFEAVGGFPDFPLMEDVEILRVLKREGRWRKIRAPLVTSPRRYQEEGRWVGWLRNTALMTLFQAGVSPKMLARFYRLRGRGSGGSGAPSLILRPVDSSLAPGRNGPSPPREQATQGRILLIFAKEPVPGRVKTRLAARIGSKKAARFYREMGRGVVDQLRGGGYRATVCFDPPGSLESIMDWLGEGGLEFRPQAPGDLGARLESAIRWGFLMGGRVVVVGTDAPKVDARVVEEAFSRLDDAEVVLGPAADGGYYLLGLRREAPDLFRGVPWSTAEVLAVTVGKAEAMGLTVATLPTLSDVDTVEDLEAHLEARTLLGRTGRSGPEKGTSC